jgi:hypothetical protein
MIAVGFCDATASGHDDRRIRTERTPVQHYCDRNKVTLASDRC